jgi:uncharacterized protein (TIGR02147 family)
MEKQLFRNILQEEIAKRCEKNPRYSLRAFSKALGLDPAAMSRILSGKIIPSAKMTRKLINELSLSLEMQEQFLNSVRSSQSSRNLQRISPFFKNSNSSIAVKPKELTADVFRTIADWHHYAILELTFTPAFKAEPKYVSKALGISELEASLALDRLFTLELLSKDGQKVAKTNHHLSTADKSVTSSAHRRRQKQILEKSVESLENDKIESRSHTGMTMAIDPTKIPEAKKMIQNFNRLLCEFLESGERTQVYELSISLFSLQKERV